MAGGMQRYLRSRSGPLARATRFAAAEAPWRRAVLDVGRDSGLGDVLMCMPALREVKRRNPAGRIRFYTATPSLVAGLPYLDEVHGWDARPEGMIYLSYEDAFPPRAHIARILADHLGVAPAGLRPDCVIDARLSAEMRARFKPGARPLVVVQRRASDWTLNKDWPDAYWLEVIARLARDCALVEIGARAQGGDAPGADYTDLRGRTSLEEMVALIAACDLYIGPVTGASHIAAAARVPAVVIVGGYELSVNAAYPSQISLANRPGCSPCWLREPCPFDRKCLSAITPERVEAAALSLLRR